MIFSGIINILNSQLTANIILLITAIIALCTYRLDVRQKIIKNTNEYVSSFLEGNWVLEIDKKNWNNFFINKLCRNSEGLFALTGKYHSTITVQDGIFTKNELIDEDIINIFSEGYDEEYGTSISNILQMLEFIADKVNKKELDIDIIRIRLLRFYQMADYYNDILVKDNTFNSENPYPNIKILYQKLSKYFGEKLPIGEYCEFPINI